MPSSLIKRFDFLKMPSKAVTDEIRKNNVQRIVYFSFMAIPVNLIHVLMFYYNLEEKGTPQYTWGMGIIISHLASMVFFTIIGFGFLLLKKKPLIETRGIDAVFSVVFFFMLMVGVAIVSVDQIVTPAITPYLVFCAVISLVVLLPPAFSTAIFLVSFLFFYFGIGVFQTNHEVLLSNRVNGITTVFVGVILSIIIWRNTVTRYSQGLIIKTQKKELEKNLSALLLKSDELEKANDSKDKLFSIIAHDLTTPFNLITGLSDFLKENINDYTIEELEKYLSNINATSVQAQTLLQELLTWARLQTGNLLFNPEEVSLEHICNRVIESVGSVAENKKIVLKLDLCKNPTVLVDKEMAKTILRNLVSNAIKYSFEGSVVEIKLFEEARFVVVSVTDKGIGIEKEKLEKLFDLLPKASKPGTANEKGSGLGLVLCREFAEKHGGKIWAESEKGKGSTFFFTLPKHGV